MDWKQVVWLAMAVVLVNQAIVQIRVGFVDTIWKRYERSSHRAVFWLWFILRAIASIGLIIMGIEVNL